MVSIRRIHSSSFMLVSSTCSSSVFNEHNLFGAYQIHDCVLTLNIMGLWKLPVSQSFLNSPSHRCKQIFLIHGLIILVIVKVKLSLKNSPHFRNCCKTILQECQLCCVVSTTVIYGNFLSVRFWQADLMARII